MSVRKLFTLLGHLLKMFEKMFKNAFEPCSPYRVKYNESESDIQNNDSLYKIDHKCQNAFERFQYLGKK